MMNQGRPSVMQLAPVVFASLMASACAVSTPATITSTKGNPQKIAGVQLLSDGGDNGPNTGLRARFHDALTQKLAARGVMVGSGAEFVADFAISQRSPDIGLQPVSQTEETAQPVEPSFKRRWYHKCKPDRVSASLVVYDRANGAVEAKSSGEFLACPGDLGQLDNLAQLLVDETLDRTIAN